MSIFGFWYKLLVFNISPRHVKLDGIANSLTVPCLRLLLILNRKLFDLELNYKLCTDLIAIMTEDDSEYKTTNGVTNDNSF